MKTRMVLLNDYQQSQLATLLQRHIDCEEIAEEWGEEPTHLMRIEYVEGRTDKLAAAINDIDGIQFFLYPQPGPINNDPQFFHAEGLKRSVEIMTVRVLKGSRELSRDLQWEHVLMDAPEIMPAGACAYFAVTEEAYGAEQVTCLREPY